MKSMDYRPDNVLPESLKDRFRNLRAAYYTRLVADRAQLMKLRVQFDRSDSSAKRLFEEIRRLAHSIATAAELFEAAHVSRIARQLEAAALAAARAPSANSDAAVRTSIDTLMELLQTFRE